jgi:hypothetical protein
MGVTKSYTLRRTPVGKSLAAYTATAYLQVKLQETSRNLTTTCLRWTR